MSFFGGRAQHKHDCRLKQREREERIATAPIEYREPVQQQDREIYSRSIQDLVKDVQGKAIKPVDILRAYGKAAFLAHRKTNCLTEILVPEAEEWLERGNINLDGPLAGIPVSLKDSVNVAGFDSTIGYSSKVYNRSSTDGSMVRLLKDAGAVPFVKTNLPITLLSFESTNDVWGRCMNPHNPKYSPGGSTGGEAALLALGGSRIGIGSDVAGSVRLPAHWSGCYSLRCSVGRWPKNGTTTSMPGQEGIPPVCSPMARTLNDLTYFTRSIIQMKPWDYDHHVVPIEWKSAEEKSVLESKQLRIGVLRDDGVITPSPACARALEMAASALRADGHVVLDISPPSPYEALFLASRLLNNDGCKTYRSWMRPSEWEDQGARQMSFWAGLPSPFRYMYYLWVKYVRRDPLWAELLRSFREMSTPELWSLTARREAYKAKWHDWWEQHPKLDFIISPPNATPALPENCMKDAVSSCGYTFLFNLLDYSAGVIPVTHVDAKLDVLPSDLKLSSLNGIARGAYKQYDAVKMEGLPVGVQIVGQRLTEERVLAMMARTEQALEKQGNVYQQLEVD